MDAIETALADLRPALDADGFDLRLGGIGPDGQITVILEARPNACHDCLVPDDLLQQIVQTSIRDRQPDAGAVVVEKRGF